MRGIHAFVGPNAAYVAELYERYRKDPASVSPEVREFFQRWSPDWGDGRPAPAPPSAQNHQVLTRTQSLVRAIRDHGHMAAALDPLGLKERREPLVEPESHGLSSEELKPLPASILQTPLAKGSPSAEEVVTRLRQVYCGSTGYEFAHLRNAQEQAWLQEAVESGQFRPALDSQARRNLLTRLTQVEVFEQFLHRSFPGHKWFSLEGNDVLVPMLDELASQAGESGLHTLVIGMAHRGRLNVLAHTFNRSYESILAEFKGGIYFHENGVEDSKQAWMLDVKYHLGASRGPEEGRDGLSLVLLPNPSHVELVDPVVVGAVRAIQDTAGSDGSPSSQDLAAAVLIHGDAAFAGEGIVAETLNLAQLSGYRTGGTLHIVVNNQLGFTTEPHEAHSTPYPTDLARGFDIPVVHVNADDVEACMAAARLAFAYRRRFQKDFVIDLVGYRRFGHNEGDEPSFTQPRMYEAIRTHPTARELFARRLVSEGVLSEEAASTMVKESRERLQQALASLPESNLQETARPPEAPEASQEAANIATAVPSETLELWNRELHALPEGFNLHPKLTQPFRRRSESLGKEGRIDWAHAEALAFASILADGVPVRLTGQDTERGTFSQRHAVLHDVKSGERFIPLQAMSSARAPFAVYNSPLSEVGALGFEYGYSVRASGSLILWEAQFGDFVNNAQAIVDEFIVSARAKWGQRSGLVLLLPHGYEGQGPNHSGAHLERFLQLAAEDNIRVAYCTTAAQYFHLLRRQASLLQTDPRPLVVMTAKSLLRHPAAGSTFKDLSESSFKSVIDDQRARSGPGVVERLVLCSGKVFVDLVTSEAYREAQRVAVLRVEELYPFPADELSGLLRQYRRATEVVWLQEEPQNRGAWTFIAPLLQELLDSRVQLRYIGRPARSSPAEGSMTLHRVEQERIIREAFSNVGRGSDMEKKEVVHGC